MNKFRCSFCRNEGATNEHKYEGNSDFIFCMCDDCDARYKQHKQLGPKFVICKCDPEHPKELDLAMAKEEIKAGTIKPQVVTVADPKKIVWQLSGPIVKVNEDEPKDKPIKTRSKRKKVYEL